jgi:hypothetical protein
MTTDNNDTTTALPYERLPFFGFSQGRRWIFLVAVVSDGFTLEGDQQMELEVTPLKPAMANCPPFIVAEVARMVGLGMDEAQDRYEKEGGDPDQWVPEGLKAAKRLLDERWAELSDLMVFELWTPEDLRRYLQKRGAPRVVCKPTSKQAKRFDFLADQTAKRAMAILRGDRALPAGCEEAGGGADRREEGSALERGAGSRAGARPQRWLEAQLHLGRRHPPGRLLRGDAAVPRDSPAPHSGGSAEARGEVLPAAGGCFAQSPRGGGGLGPGVPRAPGAAVDAPGLPLRPSSGVLAHRAR